MLILAEGTVQSSPLSAADVTAMHAWLGPMVDSGMLQNGYLSSHEGRIWMVLSAEGLTEAQQRLDDLPVVRAGQVRFTARPVTALRFS